ncbi:MAG: AsnC family transcriptional regulator [Gammaproteobacteria bacterium]|nr:AsnC family transcriptional regulator [Gammaproteobacteria bacterium]
MQTSPAEQTVYTIDNIDREIIRITQQGLPLVREPYQAIAAQLGISTQQLIERMQAMTDSGIIRRTGVVPNHYKLGYTANGMSVWNVPETLITEIGMTIGALDFVSHCYQRPRFLPEWPYNLFAMVHGRSKDEVRDKVEIIAGLLGDNNRGHSVLFSTKILKKTGLRIKD